MKLTTKKTYLNLSLMLMGIGLASLNTTFADSQNQQIKEALAKVQQIGEKQKGELETINKYKQHLAEYQLFANTFKNFIPIPIDVEKQPATAVKTLQVLVNNPMFKQQLKAVQVLPALKDKLKNLESLESKQAEELLKATIEFVNNKNEAESLLNEIILPLQETQENNNIYSSQYVKQLEAMQHSFDLLAKIRVGGGNLAEDTALFVELDNQHLKNNDIKHEQHYLTLGISKSLTPYLKDNQQLSIGTYVDVGFSGKTKEKNHTYKSENKSLGIGVFSNYQYQNVFLAALVNVNRNRIKDYAVKSIVNVNDYSFTETSDKGKHKVTGFNGLVELGYHYSPEKIAALTLIPYVAYQYHHLLSSNIATNDNLYEIALPKLKMQMLGVGLNTKYQYQDFVFSSDIGVDKVYSKSNEKNITTQLYNLYGEVYRIHANLQITKAINNHKIGANLGYNHYTKTKFNGLTYGINYSYSF